MRSDLLGEQGRIKDHDIHVIYDDICIFSIRTHKLGTLSLSSKNASIGMHSTSSKDGVPTKQLWDLTCCVQVAIIGILCHRMNLTSSGLDGTGSANIALHLQLMRKWRHNISFFESVQLQPPISWSSTAIWYATPLYCMFWFVHFYNILQFVCLQLIRIKLTCMIMCTNTWEPESQALIKGNHHIIALCIGRTWIWV